MSLLAAWNFDEASGAVQDLSGNGKTWTPTSPLTRVAGKTNTGLGRSATGGAQTLFSGAGMFGQSTDRSVMCWMKNPGNQTAWIIRWNVSAINSGGWGILLLGTQVGTQARNSANFFRAAVARPTDGLFHHYCATYNQALGELKFYYDGTLAQTTTGVTGPLRTDADSIDIFETSDTAVVLDDIRIYDETLTLAQVGTLMNTPVAAAASGPLPSGLFLAY